MVSFFGTDTSPSSGASSPTIMRKSVVLPDPLGPTRPTFSPGLSWKEASTKRICFPYCLLILLNETIGDCRLPNADRQIADWRLSIDGLMIVDWIVELIAESPQSIGSHQSVDH